MEELKNQLKAFVEKATERINTYPLNEYRTWSNHMSDEEKAHILFLHASIIYASGFINLLKEEDANDRTLKMFSGLLSQFGCDSLGIQYEYFFVLVMFDGESVFGKYEREIFSSFAKNRTHSWSVRDITGACLQHIRNVFADNSGISKSRVIDFLRRKIDLLKVFGYQLEKTEYVKLFLSWKTDQVLLRRPTWIKCPDPQQFINAFSVKAPNVEIKVCNLDDLSDDIQSFKNGVLFFIIPSVIPDNKIDVVLDLLGDAEMVNRTTLLVVLDRQKMLFGQKMHYHELLDEIKNTYHIFPYFKNREVYNVIYGYDNLKVDETGYFDYFWVDE